MAPPTPSAPAEPSQRRARGFHRAGAIVAPALAAAARRRGFVEVRLVTDWEAIAGPAIAAATRPVKMTRGRGGGGGTLTVEAEGARAPEVQLMLPTLKARVNTALGWPAVAQIRLVQAAGLAAPPGPAPAPSPRPEPDASRLAPLLAELSSIGDDSLRGALETLARHVLSEGSNRTGPGSR